MIKYINNMVSWFKGSNLPEVMPEWDADLQKEMEESLLLYGDNDVSGIYCGGVHISGWSAPKHTETYEDDIEYLLGMNINE